MPRTKGAMNSKPRRVLVAARLPADMAEWLKPNVTERLEQIVRDAMTTEQKRDTIWAIIEALKNQAIVYNKPFDVGDTFFALAFRTDKELKEIASLCGIK